MEAAPTRCTRPWEAPRSASASLPTSRWNSRPTRTGGRGGDVGGAGAGSGGAGARCGANVLIGGPAGAGKSTLLRSLVSAFPPDERVITIEDTAELELDTPHWVKLECVHSKSLGEHRSGERRLDVADLGQT